MKVTVIGLGHMGRAFSERLLARGFDVRVWNRSPGKAAGLGATFVDDLARATDGARFVLTSLSSDEAVREVVLRPGGVLDSLNPDSVHLGTSTISHGFARELARSHAERGRSYLSTPVLGRPEAVGRGELFVLAGGDAALRRKASEITGALGRETIEFEEPEQANLAKILCNFMIAGTIELLGELFVLGEKGGIPSARTLSLLTGTLFGSPAVNGYGERIAQQAFEPPGFRMQLGLKDAALALAAGDELRTPLPIASILRDRYLSALATGLEGLDWSGLTRSVRAQAGLS